MLRRAGLGGLGVMCGRFAFAGRSIGWPEKVLTDGLIDIARVRPIARLGYMDFTVVESVFTMRRRSAGQALKGAAE